MVVTPFHRGKNNFFVWKESDSYCIFDIHKEVPMNPELLKTVLKHYDDEATDAKIYSMMASKTKSEHNKAVLLAMAHDEQIHSGIWGKYANRKPNINGFKVWFYTFLANFFGLVFVINLMESGEKTAIEAYEQLGEHEPRALEILNDEIQHEAQLIDMIEEDGLSYISSIVLGLNDALVELTGALAGFTLALGNTKVICLAGFITGVAATLSMAASEYLSQKSDEGEKHPLKAAGYTGIAYMFTVAFLLLPYMLLSHPLVALAFCLGNAALIILGFTYFVSVVKRTSFVRGFTEMIVISFSVALIAFLIGWLARVWLQIDM